jgi:nucleotide-binding universal stress UspA family protein
MRKFRRRRRSPREVCAIAGPRPTAAQARRLQPLLSEAIMRIICATDFSEQSWAAAELAVGLAKALGDSVLLVHVLERPAVLGVAQSETSWEAMVRAAAESELQGWVWSMQRHGVRVEAEVVAGSAAYALQDLAEAVDVRLLVLGSHGRKGPSHFFVGSVAEDVARKAKRPVVITRGLRYPTDGLAGARRLQLLVLFDGSSASEAALAWVKELRGSIACDVTFVQPYAPRDSAERFGLEVSPSNTVGPPALRPLLENELRRWVGALPGEGDVRFRLRAVGSHIEEDLGTEAESLQPDLVVAGITGRHFGAAEHGFTAPHLLQAMKLPVVCVPETLRPPANGHIPAIRTVVVGTDLSEFSNQAVPAAYSLLAAHGGLVKICYVYERMPGRAPALGVPPAPPLAPERRQEIESRLATLAPPEAAGLGISTETTAIESDAAPEALMQEAERLDADVLVVASRGRTGVGRALMGSVAAELVKRCTRPVMVLHPPLR